MPINGEFLIKHIRRRLRIRNRNAIIIICGQTGSGKSYTGMQLGSKISEKFSIDKVVFNAKDLMHLINTGKVKRGDVILYDEVGAGKGLRKRDWYKEQNKHMNYVLQTFRHLNLCLIMTTPSFDLIDKDARKLVHYYINVMGVDYDKEKTICQIQEVSYNPKTDKFYYKNLIIRIEGLRHKLTTWLISKPNPMMIKAYEERKNVFTKSVNIEAEDEMSKTKKTKDPLMAKNIAKEILNDKKLNDKVYSEFRGRTFIDKEKIRILYPNLSTRDVVIVKKGIENPKLLGLE